MIRKLIDQLNDWYNSRSSWTQLSVLAGFCLGFLLILCLAVNYIRFDPGLYSTKIPASIGKASGPAVTSDKPQNKKR